MSPIGQTQRGATDQGAWEMLPAGEALLPTSRARGEGQTQVLEGRQRPDPRRRKTGFTMSRHATL